MSQFPFSHDNHSSQSDTSSVASWLNSLPECPKGYSFEQENILLPKNPKKRLRKGQKKTAPPAKKAKRDLRSQPPAKKLNKRQALLEMSDNIKTPQTAFRYPKCSQGNTQQPDLEPQTPTGPGKARRNRSSRRNEDPDQTPKPTRKVLGKIPILSHQSDDPYGSDRHSLPSPTSKSISSQASSSRARSPIKDISDFELSDIQVDMKDINEEEIPDDIQSLYFDLEGISIRRAIIPLELKEKVVAHLKHRNIDDMSFLPKADTHETVEMGPTAGLDPDAFWFRLLEILGRAKHCHELQLPEYSWNSEVHSSILWLALRGHWMSQGIEYRDVMAAKVTDASLLPVAASGSAMQSQMVDYAIIMKGLPGLREKIRAKLRAEGGPSINHTSASYIKYDPIAVSIETKRANIEEDKARLQLAMWVAAHFARLRQLSPYATTFPTLPLLIVQGHDWKLLLAEPKEDRSIVIHLDLKLGSTNSVVGIFQIIAAVQRLAQWINKDYRPWFEAHALSIDKE